MTVGTVEEAIRLLREDPVERQRLVDAYYEPDPASCARAFAASDEFAEVCRLAGPLAGRRVLDLGAGNGIASYAFARAGARVTALEPDPSPVVGHGAIRLSCAGLPVEVVDSFGEQLPFPDGAFDLVYARQVLHHARDLDAMLRECARVLRPGGLFLACREHVVDDEAQLREFLAGHPIHRLVGNEHAYSLPRYQAAIRGAPLRLLRTLGQYRSIINAFPECRSRAALRRLWRHWLWRKYSLAGPILGLFPGVRDRLNARRAAFAGRLFTFVARRA